MPAGSPEQPASRTTATARVLDLRAHIEVMPPPHDRSSRRLTTVDPHRGYPRAHDPDHVSRPRPTLVRCEASRTSDGRVMRSSSSRTTRVPVRGPPRWGGVVAPSVRRGPVRLTGSGPPALRCGGPRRPACGPGIPPRDAIVERGKAGHDWSGVAARADPGDGSGGDRLRVGWSADRCGPDAIRGHAACGVDLADGHAHGHGHRARDRDRDRDDVSADATRRSGRVTLAADTRPGRTHPDRGARDAGPAPA